MTLQGYPMLASGRAAEVTLDGVRIPESTRLGPAGAAYGALTDVIARAHVALAAEALGAMDAATALIKLMISPSDRDLPGADVSDDGFAHRNGAAPIGGNQCGGPFGHGCG